VIALEASDKVFLVIEGIAPVASPESWSLRKTLFIDVQRGFSTNMSNPFTLTVTKTSTSSTRIITNRSLGRHNATVARQVLRDARLSMGAPAGGQCGWRKLLAPNSLALQVEPRDFREAWPGQKIGLRWFKGLVDVGWWGQVPAMMEDSIVMHLLQFDDEVFEYIWWYVDGGEPRTNLLPRWFSDRRWLGPHLEEAASSEWFNLSQQPGGFTLQRWNTLFRSCQTLWFPGPWMLKHPQTHKRLSFFSYSSANV